LIPELTEFCHVIDIKPHRINMYDCFQNAIISALEGFGIGEENIMLGTWGFRFLIDDTCHLGVGNSNYMSDLAFIKNITLIQHEEKDVDCIFDAAERELKNNRPFIIYQDTFYNPWSLLYQKEHVDHYFVVMGIDEQRKRLLCIDNYASDSYQILERKQMEKGGMKEYITIAKKNGNEKSSNEMARYLYQKLSEQLQKEDTPFYYLKEFAKIENLKNFIDRIDNIELSEEIRKLARVRDMRKGFANDIMRFNGEPNLVCFGEQMMESNKLFARMVVLVVKCKKLPTRQEKFLIQMSEIASEIHDKEKACIEDMYQYLKSYFAYGDQL